MRAGPRSANTLREFHRYSQPDGHFGFWFGMSAQGITYADVAAIGFPVPFQEGTRHSLLTALAQGGMSERMLRAFSRHRDGRSLDHYAKPKITREAIVRALPSPAARADASPRWSG